MYQIVADSQREITYLEQTLGLISPSGELPAYTVAQREVKFREVAVLLDQFALIKQVSMRTTTEEYSRYSRTTRARFRGE